MTDRARRGPAINWRIFQKDIDNASLKKSAKAAADKMLGEHSASFSSGGNSTVYKCKCNLACTSKYKLTANISGKFDLLVDQDGEESGQPRHPPLIPVTSPHGTTTSVALMEVKKGAAVSGTNATRATTGHWGIPAAFKGNFYQL